MAQLFTLEEANAVVEKIRPLFEQVLDIRRMIVDKRPEIWAFLVKAASNGGSGEASRVYEDFQRLQKLIHAIMETGVEIKDIDTGLVDFHAIRDGREVLLCWKYGEGDIQFWHDLDAGFSGRRPI